MLFALLACQDPDPKDPGTTPGTDDSGATDSVPTSTDDTATDDTATDDTATDRYGAVKEAMQTDLDANSGSAITVAVMEHGEITWAYALGSGHPNRDEPVDTETLFQIGSVTKMMTATALLQKVQAGLVSVDAPVEAALPEFEFHLSPEWDDSATVHHLLSMQSGLYDYVHWGGESTDGSLAAFNYGEYADTLWAMNPAGKFYNYSNPNYALMGVLTEEHDTRYWPDIVVEDVLRPLGMQRSVARLTEVLADGNAASCYGYDASDLTSSRPRLGAVETEEVPDPAAVRPAGEVWSTPTELLHMADFLMHGNAILDDSLRDQMLQRHAPSLYDFGGWGWGYGYGVLVGNGIWGSDGSYTEVPFLEHSGATLCFTSYVLMLPEQDFAVAMIGNGYNDWYPATIDAVLATLVDGMPAPSAAPVADIDLSKLDEHVGTYVDAFNFGDILITRVDDTLHIDIPLLTSLGYFVDPVLDQYRTDLFLMDIDGYSYDLTFVDDTDGSPSAYLRNRGFVGTRVDEEASPEAAPPPSRDQVRRLLEAGRIPREEMPAHLNGRR